MLQFWRQFREKKSSECCETFFNVHFSDFQQSAAERIFAVDIDDMKKNSARRSRFQCVRNILFNGPTNDNRKRWIPTGALAALALQSAVEKAEFEHNSHGAERAMKKK